MELSTKTQEVLDRVNESDKMGDLKKIAREVKKDHEIAMELWSTGEFRARMLAVLLLDKNLLDQGLIDQMDLDMGVHNEKERNYISEWLMANQLMKSKKNITLLESWMDSPSAMQRRLFWYHQARLRWTGQTPPDNTEELLNTLETQLAEEAPEVQWAMNFAAGWIGVYDEAQRQRCVALGEKTGLYKEEKVPKNCTPNYLPEFIRVEAGKRK